MNPGLCAHCRHGRPIEGARSTFWLCERSRSDPAYPRYPRLPVVHCAGFEDSEAHDGHLCTEAPRGPRTRPSVDRWPGGANERAN